MTIILDKISRNFQNFSLVKERKNFSLNDPLPITEKTQISLNDSLDRIKLISMMQAKLAFPDIKINIVPFKNNGSKETSVPTNNDFETKNIDPEATITKGKKDQSLDAPTTEIEKESQKETPIIPETIVDEKLVNTPEQLGQTNKEKVEGLEESSPENKTDVEAPAITPSDEPTDSNLSIIIPSIYTQEAEKIIQENIEKETPLTLSQADMLVNQGLVQLDINSGIISKNPYQISIKDFTIRLAVLRHFVNLQKLETTDLDKTIIQLDKLSKNINDSNTLFITAEALKNLQKNQNYGFSPYLGSLIMILSSKPRQMKIDAVTESLNTFNKDVHEIYSKNLIKKMENEQGFVTAKLIRDILSEKLQHSSNKKRPVDIKLAALLKKAMINQGLKFSEKGKAMLNKLKDKDLAEFINKILYKMSDELLVKFLTNSLNDLSSELRSQIIQAVLSDTSKKEHLKLAQQTTELSQESIGKNLNILATSLENLRISYKVEVGENPKKDLILELIEKIRTLNTISSPDKQNLAKNYKDIANDLNQLFIYKNLDYSYDSRTLDKNVTDVILLLELNSSLLKK